MPTKNTKTKSRRTAKAVGSGPPVRQDIPATEKRFDLIADFYRQMENAWALTTIAEKKRLVKIAKTKTPTNCGWHAYGAAQHVLRRASFSGA